MAYALSLRDVEEMMAESVDARDHPRRAIKLVWVMEKTFHQRKLPVGESRRMYEIISKFTGSGSTLPRRRQLQYGRI